MPIDRCSTDSTADSGVVDYCADSADSAGGIDSGTDRCTDPGADSGVGYCAECDDSVNGTDSDANGCTAGACWHGEDRRRQSESVGRPEGLARRRQAAATGAAAAAAAV